MASCGTVASCAAQIRLTVAANPAGSPAGGITVVGCQGENATPARSAAARSREPVRSLMLYRAVTAAMSTISWAAWNCSALTLDNPTRRMTPSSRSSARVATWSSNGTSVALGLCR